MLMGGGFLPMFARAGASAALPLDGIANVAAAYSLRRLRSGYTGSAVRVRRSSDSTEQDIGFDGSGEFDSAAFSSFVGAGTGYVKTWYDQSGNARDATQATLADQPVIGLGIINGKAVVTANGLNYLASANGIPQTVANSIFSVSVGPATGSNATGAGIIAWGDVQTPGKRRCQVVWNGGSGNAKYVWSGYGANLVSTVGLGSATLFSSVVNSASSAVVYGSGTLIGGPTTLALLNYTSDDIYLFSTGPSVERFTGSIAEVIAISAAISTADHNTIGANMATRYGLTWTAVS